jgi:ligand-binding sensor domain-containing protein/signal transduction histidine kinase
VSTDRAGLRWIGTINGLYRFDGYQLQNFNVLTGRKLPSTEVWKVVEDEQQQFWIATDAGLFRYAPLQPGRPLQKMQLLPSRRSSIVKDILPAGHGHLWVVTPADGLLRIDQTGRVLQHCKVIDKRGVPFVLQSAAVLPTGNLLLTVFQGPILHVDPRRGQQIACFRPPGHHEKAISIAQLPRTASDTLWLVTATQRLAVCPGDTLPRLVASLNDPKEDPTSRPVLSLLALTDQRRNIWVAKEKRLVCFDAATRQLTDVTPLLGGKNRIISLREDAYHNIWVATNAGLVQLRQPPANQRFDPTLAPPSQLLPPSAVTTFSTRGIVSDEGGNLYVGSYAGLFRRRAADLKWERLPLNHPGAFARALLLDADRRTLWIGTEGKGLIRYDTQTRHCITIADDDSLRDINVNFITTLWQQPDGRLWVGGYHDLRIYDPKHARFQGVLRQTLIYSLHPRPNGGLWAATSHGLLAFDATGALLDRFVVTPPGENQDVTSIWQASDSSLWLGTRTAGLVWLNPTTRALRRWNKTHGLSDNTVYSLLPAADSGLWLGTQHGLTYFPFRPDQPPRVYFKADGLADDEFNQGSAGYLPDGRLVMGGIQGLTVIGQQGGWAGKRPGAPLLLTSVSYLDGASGKMIESGWRQPHEPLMLQASDRFITLHFTLADYAPAHHTSYAYRLSPAGEEAGAWQPLGSTPKLRLPALAPGSYVLTVKAAGATGRWSPNLLRVPITIHPPWWRTPWAIGLGVLVLLLLVWAAYKVRMRLLLKAAQRESYLRSRLAADLHDEVGSVLARVSVQAQMLREQASESQLSLDELVEDSRQAALTMRDIVWSVDAGADSVGALVDRLRDHLDATARAAGWNAQLHANGLDPATPLASDTRQQLYLIGKEAITNVLRHGREVTEVTITLGPGSGANGLRLSVENNGALVTTPPKRSGVGIRSMTLRAKLLGAPFSAGHLPEGGWCVKVG